MPSEVPFGAAVELLQHHLADLETAGREAEEDPAAWGGWSWRFNQRLGGDRRRLGILAPPPGDAGPRPLALYEAAVAIRALWEATNVYLQGGSANIVGAQASARASLLRAHALRADQPESER